MTADVGAGFSPPAAPGFDGLKPVATFGVAFLATTGAGFFASSGKNFGITALQRARNAIEITTAMKMRFSISGDGVPTSRIQRMAVRQPLDTEPQPAREAVLFDRLHHVD